MSYEKMWYDKRETVYLERADEYLENIEIDEADKDKYREHIMETGWTGCVADW
jgi:hypothetical protein